MDFHSCRRDEIASKIASDISEVLSIEGLRHFLYMPNKVNDGVAFLSDSPQPFDHAKFELLLPIKWDVAISHLDESGDHPFGILRVFTGDFWTIHRLNMKSPTLAAKTILENIR